MKRLVFSVIEFQKQGSPLTEEQGLNINQNIFTDDIFELANKLGIDVEAKNIDNTFVVKELNTKSE